MTVRVLTGVTTTGTPHLGNYVGAIRPAIEQSVREDRSSYYFLADYHGLIKCHDPEVIHRSTLIGAATWLAGGLDYERATFYRQSDLPQVLELNWILNCICAKGLMNRAHAYKAAIQENQEKGDEDLDHGVEMGLYCYPVLMAADILIFNADLVPVGRDQLQHLEMTRDIAQRFNHRFKELFSMPEALVDENIPILLGLDGRKMSKSYGNTIPLFEEEKQLKKAINRIVTNALEPGEPKSVECPLFDLYKAFATAEQTKEMKRLFAEGIGWGDAKKMTFELVNGHLAEKRERFNELVATPAKIEEILRYGAEKAGKEADERIRAIRDAVGIREFR